MPDLPRLPTGFRWGVSTSSYQIEGASTAHGKGPSIWDVFTHERGRIADGSTGDVACDHYHRCAEDVELMADLGVDAYRFSIAWPRVRPTGTGPANAAGLGFYDRLVDALLSHGIDPVATLYHWDLPQPLQEAGGWMSRDTADRFAEYAAIVAEALGDRVKMWITLNEPWWHMALGYALGVHAPGERLLMDSLPVAHHQLLGHGLAVQALRLRSGSQIAVANAYSPVWTVGDREEDRAAAQVYDALMNRLFTDPLLGLDYPDLPGLAEVVRDGDMETIAAPIDALGVNYYNPAAISAPSESGPLPFQQIVIEGYPKTSFGWPVAPDGMREILVILRERYGQSLPPIYITESGCAYDAPLQDQERVTYHDGHLRAVNEAIDAGVDVRGYFVWSLMDNFEWAEGYRQRFGLVHVDFATQKRTPKASYHWYRKVIAQSR